jgi:hypothetical protein
MAILLASNISSINCGGVISANTSPLTNVATQAVTGIYAFNQDTGMALTSTTTLVPDQNLSISINETGNYKIDGFFGFYSTAAAIAAANGVTKLTIGGTAVIKSLMMGTVSGSSGAGVSIGANTNTATAGITTTAAANANVQVFVVQSLKQYQPDVVIMSGFVQISTVGTLFPMWAPAVSTLNNITRSANCYFGVVKIG